MSLWANDAALAVMRALLPLGARVADGRMRRRIASFREDQATLRARYGVTSATPIVGYDDATRARVLALLAADPTARTATTSGTTGAPKELAYPKERLAHYRRDSIASALGFLERMRVAHPSLFVLASLKQDDSFASLVLHERPRNPPWLATLIEPSRALAHPRMRSLMGSERGALLSAGALTAARVLLLAAADPGMLYATNPSTLVTFFTEVMERWHDATAFVRRVARGDLATDAELRRLLARIGTKGMFDRLERIAAAEAPLPVEAWLPSLRAYVTWDGGYVTAFLPALHRLLPPARVTHVPMYSMSTEAIETLPVLLDDVDSADDTGDDVAFLPLGPRVLVELLPEHAPDDASCLIAPADAKAGGLYSLVVSDPWGLVRYQTEDLFLCRRIVHGLPDLRFVRRRGLQHSFTGEKLTGEQLTTAFAALRTTVSELANDVELSCLPSQPTDQELPRYVLVLAPASDAARVALAALDLASIGRALDASLSAQNSEWDAKRKSGRLAPISTAIVPYLQLAAALDRRTSDARDVEQRPWESQFKLNPLTKVSFEELSRRLAS